MRDNILDDIGGCKKKLYLMDFKAFAHTIINKPA